MPTAPDRRAEPVRLPEGLEGAEVVAWFELLAQMTDALVFLMETGGKVLWVNHRFVEHTGRTLEDFQFEQPDNPFLHPEDAPRVGRFFAGFLASPEAISAPVENRFYDRWGQVQHYRSLVAKVRWRGAPALMLLTVPRNAAVEGALETSEARFRGLVDAASDGIVTLGADGAVRFANRQFLEMVGLDAVALGHRRVWELLAQPDREAGRARFEEAARRRATFRGEARLQGRDGQVRDVELSASYVEEPGHDETYLAIVRDVTESRRLAERTRQAQKLEELGVLAGGIAHDFNNIVGAILGNTSLALARLSEGARVEPLLADVQAAARRAAALSGSLLQYVGRAPTRREALDLSALAGELVQLSRSMVSKRVAVELRADGAVRVVGDAAQLQQVLLNLVVNGAEAVAGDGRVVVEVLEAAVDAGRDGWSPRPPGPGPCAVLRVRDDGCGMDEVTRRRMFDPFFTTKARGRGLGLSAVLGIVTGHDGAIRVESVPGKGTLFEVALRLAPPEARAAPQPKPGAAIAQAACRASLLFVDDEELLRRVGQAILERAGHRVAVAQSAEEALERVREAPGKFQLVVLDQNMPGMGGRAGAQLLRELEPALRLLLTSGYGEEARAPGMDFLAKPYTADQLVAAVEGALAGPAGR